MVDSPAKFIFSAEVSLPAVRRAAADTQDDLDLIASCASLALNSPGKAVLPATFAENTNAVFPKATMPDPLPLPEISQITIPDWVNLDARLVVNGGVDQDGIVHKSAAEVGLRTQMMIVPNRPGREGEIASTIPPAGIVVPARTLVVLNVFDSAN